MRHAHRTRCRRLIHERRRLLRVSLRHRAREQRLQCHVRLRRFGARAHLDKRVDRGQRGALGAFCVESVEPLLVVFAQFQHHADDRLAIEASRGPAPARRAAAAYHAAVADATAVRVGCRRRCCGAIGECGNLVLREARAVRNRLLVLLLRGPRSR